MAEARTPLHAQDKLLLLLSLVPYLMDHDRVAVGDVAEHFGVSPQQIRDAVRLIAVSGVPGETRQYQPGDLFDIAWDDFEQNDQIVLTHLVAIDDSPRFSAREASALIAGLQYLSALPENQDREAIGMLMTKLARGSSATPSEVAVAGADADAALAPIRSAIETGTQVEFDYLNARGEHERRRVDPLRVESVDQDWYLRGWCHLRQAVRTFRFDRMASLEVTGEPASDHGAHASLPENLFEGSPEDLLVDIDVAASARVLLADYLREAAPGVEENGVIHTSMRVTHYHGLKRLAARLSGVLTVTGPAEARRAVAEWAAAGAARYENKHEHEHKNEHDTGNA
ncbi:WYL domain-containing protein [Microbacterium sp. STN6]|uniref:helix-turn-helix transcriptional regulator n=1 Tax=Microbacterium sp. STN6 TaxID=2995588 RepID=UPI002260BA01|nr:WYL domain-containing protein [Microbacterium sp. STN6]MCX7521564.1 WYL domain-containing protein [Microbacterium sp. STN6]